jgi:hypothetical protein
MCRYISPWFSFNILHFKCIICTRQLQRAINAVLFVEYLPEDGQHRAKYVGRLPHMVYNHITSVQLLVWICVYTHMGTSRTYFLNMFSTNVIFFISGLHIHTMLIQR